MRLLAVLLIVGCSDADLVYDGGPLRGWLDAGPDAGASAIADQCGSARAAIGESFGPMTIDTAVAQNDAMAECAGGRFGPGFFSPGNDVFVAIEAQPGDVWHFHLDADDPISNANLAVYESDCTTCLDAVNDCTAGDEHIAFRSETGGLYYVAVDDQEDGGRELAFEAIRLVCADGERGHGEACDDGDVADGDGCDHLCRSEIVHGADFAGVTQEREPNNDRFQANVLVLDASAETTLHGQLGGTECKSPDYIALTLDAPRLFEAAFVDDDGVSCDASRSPARVLQLMRIDGTPLGFATTEAAGCMSITNGLPVGEYLLSVYPALDADEPAQFDYRIRITLTP